MMLCISVPTLATPTSAHARALTCLSLLPSLPPSAQLQKLCEWVAPSPRRGGV